MTDQVETKKVKWEDLEVAEDQDHPVEVIIGSWERVWSFPVHIKNEVREDHGECIGIIDDPLIVDWQEDTMRVLRDLTIRAYGLTPADLEITPAEANKRAIAIARDAQKIETEFSSAMEALEKVVDAFTEFIGKLVDVMQPVIDQIDAFWQAWNGYPRLRKIWQAEVDQVQIEFERQECVRIMSEQIQRDLSRSWPSPITPVPDTDVNRFRGIDEFIQDYIRIDGVDMHTSVLDFGEHTEEEMKEFQMRWMDAMSHISAFCTPSRNRLTGR